MEAFNQTSMIKQLQECFSTLPYSRRGFGHKYSMLDAGMSAFSVFFMQSDLAYQTGLQKQQGGNREFITRKR